MENKAYRHLGELGEKHNGGGVVGESAVGRLRCGDEDPQVDKQASVRAEDGKCACRGEHCAEPTPWHDAASNLMTPV